MSKIKKVKKIKWFTLIKMIIFTKHFKSKFEDVIFYALENYELKRGKYASEVLLFDKCCKYTKKIIKVVEKEDLDWIEKIAKNIRRSL